MKSLFMLLVLAGVASAAGPATAAPLMKLRLVVMVFLLVRLKLGALSGA